MNANRANCGELRKRGCAKRADRLHLVMVIIRFDDVETEKKALDYLVGRYSFKTWSNGDLMLPEPALGELAAEGVVFRVKGPATYEHFLPAVRNTATATV